MRSDAKREICVLSKSRTYALLIEAARPTPGDAAHPAAAQQQEPP
jgi:hypothetical protein